MDIKDFDTAAQDVIDSIPKHLDQAQYSTHHQLYVLYQVAVKMKLYDAADVIKNLIADRS
jgi:hypothetical protein